MSSCDHPDPDGDVVLVLTDCQHSPTQSKSSPRKRKRRSSDTSEETASDHADEGRDTIELRVSSKHLKMVSSVFRAMPSDMFREGRELMSTSHLKLPLPDDDPDALRILLNMIHGHAYRLPQEVAFCTLADIAVLVDKYALHEIAEVYCRFWVEEARVQAMTICWVFGQKKDFQKATQVIQRDAQALSRSGVCTLPDRIIALIYRDREEAFSKLLSDLARIIECYSGPDDPDGGRCLSASKIERSACDAMVLGGLMKNMKRAGLRSMPSTPYKGPSFARVRRHLQVSYPIYCRRYEYAWGDSLDRPALYKGLSFTHVWRCLQDSYPKYCRRYGYAQGDSLDAPRKHCRILEQVKSTTDDIWDSLQGVDLDVLDKADRNERGRGSTGDCTCLNCNQSH